MQEEEIYRKIIPTPIGNMVAYIARKGLCYLDFDTIKEEHKEGKTELELVRPKNYIPKELLARFFIETELNARTSNTTKSEQLKEMMNKLETQLKEYFSGKRKEFTIPLILIGTDFQKKVWQELLKIPYGQTISYKKEAINIGNPKAYRAVANANGKNKISIIIPCHRVIAHNGLLGGYSGGLDRKQYLLDLELMVGGL
jgi:O-6-methylguanine DNA methyltransferase